MSDKTKDDPAVQKQNRLRLQALLKDCGFADIPLDLLEMDLCTTLNKQKQSGAAWQMLQLGMGRKGDCHPPINREYRKTFERAALQAKVTPTFSPDGRPTFPV